MLRFVVSTRCANENEFLSETLTGRSLRKISRVCPFVLHVSYAAQHGLAAVYNPVIEMAAPEDILVFMHDDVIIDDWLLHTRLKEALSVYELVGVVGNQVRRARQIGWYGMAVQEDGVTVDFTAHGVHCGGVLYANAEKADFWTDAPREVALLDGVFLAACAGVMQQHNIRFDAQFAYHLYDLDLCRQFEQAGLKMGTWPIALSHESGGVIDEVWYAHGLLYLSKWRD